MDNIKVVSAELAAELQEADALTILEVLSLAIKNGDQHVVKYCAQVLRVKLHGAALEGSK